MCCIVKMLLCNRLVVIKFLSWIWIDFLEFCIVIITITITIFPEPHPISSPHQLFTKPFFYNSVSVRNAFGQKNVLLRPSVLMSGVQKASLCPSCHLGCSCRGVSHSIAGIDGTASLSLLFFEGHVSISFQIVSFTATVVLCFLLGSIPAV